jgi:hypothetical protein
LAIEQVFAAAHVHAMTDAERGSILRGSKEAKSRP